MLFASPLSLPEFPHLQGPLGEEKAVFVPFSNIPPQPDSTASIWDATGLYVWPIYSNLIPCMCFIAL